MFSLQPCDELVFANNPATSQVYQIPDDLIVDHSLLETNLISFSATSATSTTTTANHHRLQSQTTNFRSPRRRKKDQIKHAMHRDVERRRRQEMSSLHASLRALLPIEHNKGKSSVCNQMEEAANYIKQMHRKIEELQTRRDNLKKLYTSSSGNNSLHNRVAINRAMGGLEILISNKSSEFELSQVLAQLLEERDQLDVVSCVSTRSKAGFLHKIEIKARDMASIDVSVLHDRVIRVIASQWVKI